MRNTGHPIVLTINDKAELIVQDAVSYQQLLNKIEEPKEIVEVKQELQDWV